MKEMKKVTRTIALALVFCMMFSNVVFAAEKGDKTAQGDFLTRAAAPPLTEFYVHGVTSENYPNGETIQHSSSVYPTATVLDHGGSWLRVTTFEMGYAKSRVATFNNTPMKRERIQSVDVDGDRVIDGYFVTWLYEGDVTSGYFSANSKSANSPWNTMYITNFRIR